LPLLSFLRAIIVDSFRDYSILDRLKLKLVSIRDRPREIIFRIIFSALFGILLGPSTFLFSSFTRVHLTSPSNMSSILIIGTGLA